jgi:hypothetical protein
MKPEPPGAVEPVMAQDAVTADAMRNPQISVLNRSIHKLLYREHWYRVWCPQVLAVSQHAGITCARGWTFRRWIQKERALAKTPVQPA